ncbi:MAG: 30S ribosomal protein S8 [Acidobacteria bacterium]|nr:30S ribosomal protein S8 [Acidobacteriota bacterium]MXZ38939.1 30S ribosomal protein S8 [Holophagales bacterium]MYF05110.1 30S ribosomal protein S8 [Holophagales bacterium]MYJ24396.1 30S ribosomal protein S8 [Holophagales bacterium]
MTVTDPIADLLTTIRNALIVKHDRTEAPASKLKIALCRVLRDQGYINDYEVFDSPPGRTLRIFLAYDREGVPAITRLRKISKPGRRVYRAADDLKPVLNGLGVAVLSTSQGLLTDAQARRQRVGGEVLCEVY